MSRRQGSSEEHDSVNPYIALSDLLIGLVLIIIFFVALGRLGLENVKYRETQREIAEAVSRDIAEKDQPVWLHVRKDPPGVQRWAFIGSSLFDYSSPESRPRLSDDGARALTEFAKVLSQFQPQADNPAGSWIRIRVEGHTRPPKGHLPDDWELSALRAAIVARTIQVSGGIKPWYFAVSGRAGQNHLCRTMLCIDRSSDQLRTISGDLDRRGITYTVKPYDDAQAMKEVSDQVKSTELQSLFASYQKELRPALYVDVSEESPPQGMAPRFISNFEDGESMTTLTNQFRRNELVEILLEFFTAKPGN